MARLFLMLVHAANSSPDLLEDLTLLPPAEVNPELMRRVVQLWSTDLRRLAEANRYRDQTAAAMGETISKQAHAMAQQADQLLAATTDSARLTKLLVMASAGVTNLNTRLALSRDNEQTLRNELDDLTKQLVAASAEVTNLNTRLALSRDNEQTLRSELDDLTKQLVAASAQVTNLNTRLALSRDNGPRRLAHFCVI